MEQFKLKPAKKALAFISRFLYIIISIGGVCF